MSDKETVTTLGLPEELLKPLFEMQAQLATYDQHVADMAIQVGQLEHLTLDILKRVTRLENKTACLSDQPGRKNCPKCTKIVSNPNAQRCQHCGHELYQ